MNELERVHLLLGKASVAALVEEEIDFLRQILVRVDSLQQQVNDQVQKIHMLKVANSIQKDTAVDWDKLIDRVTAERDALHDQIVERDRTIDMLTEQITAEVAISAKAIANLRDARALLIVGRYDDALARMDKALGRE